ncbi:unnamed protein product [Rotaria sp. Silwood1]|nr:unnamed protein product [Rotaria sp. Silwood1]CAF3571189.1 unnamed protein product [Rotaria sp. Silwood1]
MLAERLVYERSASVDYEKMMITEFQKECGHMYTLKLNKMIENFCLKENLMKKYQEHCENQQSLFNFSCMVLATNLWPFSVISDFNLPFELASSIDNFIQFYCHQHNKQKLTWLYQYSRGELHAYFTKSTYVLQVSAYEMVILLLYNNSLEWTIEQIYKKTHIKTDILMEILYILIKSDLLTCLQIRKEDLKEKNLQMGHMIRLNDNFTSFDSILTSFRQPFWLSEKRWLVTCDYIMELKTIALYTIPMRTDDKEKIIRYKASSTNTGCFLTRIWKNTIDFVEDETITTLKLSVCPAGTVSNRRERFYNFYERPLPAERFRLDQKIGPQHLADAFKNCSTNFCGTTFTVICDTWITEIELSSNHIRNDGMKYLASALKNNKTLKALYLQWNFIGDLGVQYLADTLQVNTTITTLHLAWNIITNVGVRYLADALKCNTTLTTLNLVSNNIFDDGIKDLADALIINTTLTTLHLGSNVVGNAGAQYFANALRHNKTLTSLHLGSNKVEDEGAKHLADALESNITLTMLYINFNKIGEHWMKHIASAVEKNKVRETVISSG